MEYEKNIYDKFVNKATLSELNNHLSNKNHKILAEQVMNFFLKNLNPVPGQFKGYHEM